MVRCQLSGDWALGRARELVGKSVSVVNVVHQVTEAGSVLVFEWTAMTELHDESWPVPAATLCHLGPGGEVVSRKDFGSWLKASE